MIRKSVRLVIAGVLLLTSIFCYIKGFGGFGFWAAFLSSLAVLFHFKNERNLLTFLFVRRNKLETAEKILNSVKHPEGMIKSQEAYHHYLKGLVLAQKNERSKAEKLFKTALNIGLRSSMDQSVARLNLASFCLAKRNKKLAKYHLQECKKLDKRKMLTEQIREVEFMMKRI